MQQLRGRVAVVRAPPAGSGWEWPSDSPPRGCGLCWPTSKRVRCQRSRPVARERRRSRAVVCDVSRQDDVADLPAARWMRLARCIWCATTPASPIQRRARVGGQPGRLGVGHRGEPVGRHLRMRAFVPLLLRERKARRQHRVGGGAGPGAAGQLQRDQARGRGAVGGAARGARGHRRARGRVGAVSGDGADAHPRGGAQSAGGRAAALPRCANPGARQALDSLRARIPGGHRRPRSRPVCVDAIRSKRLTCCRPETIGRFGGGWTRSSAVAVDLRR